MGNFVSRFVDVGRFVVAVCGCLCCCCCCAITLIVAAIVDAFTTDRVRQQPLAQTRNSGRIDRSRYLDNSKTTVEWNCDEFPEVGRPTVITLHVS